VSLSTSPVAELVSPLSPRELAVLRQLMQGAASKVIATQLGVCEAAVKVHLGSLCKKLGVQDRIQAQAAAQQRGICYE
jgi:two-component system, NarL family, nitrate/nitrite response regulator NarL